jgi:hypothetical protein
MLKKTRLHCIVPILLFVPFISFAQQDNRVINAEYTGKVEYVFGTFGSFNPPKANDSVTVEIINDSLLVKFIPDRYVDGSGVSGGLRVSEKYLRVNQEYKDIITPTEEKATGSYNVRYTIGNKNNSPNTNIQIVHMGDGKMANMTLINVTDSFVGDILVAKLNKVK